MWVLTVGPLLHHHKHCSFALLSVPINSRRWDFFCFLELAKGSIFLSHYSLLFEILIHSWCVSERVCMGLQHYCLRNSSFLEVHFEGFKDTFKNK